MQEKEIYYQNLANTVIKNMEKRQISGLYCKNREEALEKIFSMIPEGSSIAWGGSSSIKQVGVLEKAKNGNYACIDRNDAKTKEELKEIYGKVCGCDYFFMSSNAITIDGELVNIDGTGNRLAFLCFGPEHVFVVAGMNKIVSNVQEGIDRTRNVAAPPNTVRLGRNTPCSVTGRCHDCQSDDCICANTVITRRSIPGGRITVFLVGEELGY